MPTLNIPVDHREQLTWLCADEQHVVHYYREYAMRLRAVVTSFVLDTFNAAHHATIDDATQEALLEFLQIVRDPVKSQKITGEPFRYLAGIAANKVRRAWRAQARHEPYLDLDADEKLDPTDPAEYVADCDDIAAQKQRLLECIERLPGLQREVIKRQYAALQNGQCELAQPKEIASVMQKNSENVRNALCLAKKNLVQCLSARVPGSTSIKTERRP